VYYQAVALAGVLRENPPPINLTCSFAVLFGAMPGAVGPPCEFLKKLKFKFN
jgi:hypothetical protein